MNRIIGISDIHGEYDKLCRVLDKVSPQKDDTFVFMGDYIDRGPKSKEVVDAIINLQQISTCIYLMGSHEYAMLHAKTDEYYRYLFWNYGGDKTVESYGSFENIINIHGDFFNSLKFYHQTKNYIFVHAGLKKGIPLEEQEKTDMVYIRSEFYSHPHNFGKKIIFGHTEFDYPLVQTDKICIDTGCGKYKNAPLTAIICKDSSESFINSNF